MNRYKALIKHEIKTLKWILLYFFLAVGIYAGMITNRLHNFYISYLEQGIGRENIISCHFMSVFQGEYGLFVILCGIGIILLINTQFKEIKNNEVGRFLKGLPVSGKKVYVVKTLCGMFTYTVPFVILGGYLMMIRASNYTWLQPLLEVTSFSSLFELVNGWEYLLVQLLMYYLIISFAYYFLVIMQYLIMSTKAGIAIGLLISFVPVYLELIIERRRVGWIDQTVYLPWLYGMSGRQYGFSSGNQYISIGIIQNMGLKIGYLCVLTVVCAILGYRLSQRFRVEQMDLMMPLKISRIIFILGVTLCSALLPIFIKENMMRYSRNTNYWLILLAMAVLGLVGFVVSRKIATLGMKEGRKKAYEEV